MNEKTKDEPPTEQSLVKLYMEVAGTSESSARSVFMYVIPSGEETSGERQTKTGDSS